MKKHICQSDYDHTTTRYEQNTEPSVTVPDQAMSIAEIIRRFASGQPLDGERTPFYEDEDNEEFGNVPDLSRMDKVDIAMLAVDHKAHISELKQKAKAEQEQLNETKKQLKEAEKTERTTAPEPEQGKKEESGGLKNPNPGKNFGPKADEEKGGKP